MAAGRKVGGQLGPGAVLGDIIQPFLLSSLWISKEYQPNKTMQ